MNRKAVLLIAAALIYVGASIIGMAGHGGQGFAVILALMLLYTVLLRPAAQWSGPGLAGVLRFGLTVAVLAILSGALWLFGRGLAYLVGELPVWPGIALALAGITLSRAVWNPTRQAQLDALLDDALLQLQGGGATGPADNEARWGRLNAVRSQVNVDLSLEAAHALAATLASDLDSELYREAMIDLSDLQSAGALRLQLALMARREVMPWWYDVFTVLSLLQVALDLDEETALLACDIADYCLSEPDVDLIKATALLDGLEARLAALPADGALAPRLQEIVEPLRVAASTLGGRKESDALAAGLALLEAGDQDGPFMAWLEARPLTEAMQSLLELADRAEQGDRLAAHALVLYATRPEVVRSLAGMSVPAIAFLRIDNEVALNTLFVQRARALLAQMQDAAANMPHPEEMQTRATTLGLPDMAQLADQVDRLRKAYETRSQSHA